MGKEEVNRASQESCATSQFRKGRDAWGEKIWSIFIFMQWRAVYRPSPMVYIYEYKQKTRLRPFPILFHIHERGDNELQQYIIYWLAHLWVVRKSFFLVCRSLPHSAALSKDVVVVEDLKHTEILNQVSVNRDSQKKGRNTRAKTILFSTRQTIR